MNIEEVFRKLRPIMGPQLDALWQEYLVSDTSIRQTIEWTLRVMLAQRLSETFQGEHVLLRPPPREVAAGEYPVGLIHYGTDGFYPFGLREPEFIQHIGIFGRSGSGKTNVATPGCQCTQDQGRATAYVRHQSQSTGPFVGGTRGVPQGGSEGEPAEPVPPQPRLPNRHYTKQRDCLISCETLRSLLLAD